MNLGGADVGGCAGMRSWLSFAGEWEANLPRERLKLTGYLCQRGLGAVASNFFDN